MNPTTPRYEGCDDPERLAAHRREYGPGSVEVLITGERWHRSGLTAADEFSDGLKRCGFRYRLVHSSPPGPPNPCARQGGPVNPTHPTPDTPTPPGMVCAAEHPTDGFMCCTRPVGHGGNHAAEDGTIVYKRWPVTPPVPPNPCALEDVPDGAEWANDEGGPWNDGLHHRDLVPRLAVWWRWPEPEPAPPAPPEGWEVCRDFDTVEAYREQGRARCLLPNGAWSEPAHDWEHPPNNDALAAGRWAVPVKSDDDTVLVLLPRWVVRRVAEAPDPVSASYRMSLFWHACREAAESPGVEP